MVADDPVAQQVGTNLETDLVDAGLEEAQARAMRRSVERAVDQIVARFATRTELHVVRDELRAEMHSMRDELRTEIHSMRDQLHTEMRAMRDDLRAEIGSAIAASQQRVEFQLKVSWAVFLLVGGGLMGMMAAILARL